MNPNYLIYPLLAVLIGLVLISFFLIWQWFDARDRLHIVREDTREETIRAIRRGHNKCRVLLYISIVLAAAYIFIPLAAGDYYNTLVYPGVVILADILMLIGLRTRAKGYLNSMDYYVNVNEEHVREAAEERAKEREEWKREAKVLNPQAEAYIREQLGDKYEVWFKHDILVGRNVLANMEEGLLYAQGIVIPFSAIREVRQGRKDLKLVTSDSTYPFITLDFGALPVNPETGNKYKDEIAERLESLIG